MIRTSNLQFSYNDHTVFQFPDINCELGDTLLITGESGSGKTTMLHILGGILKPNSGNIQLENINIENLNGSKLDRYRGEHISIIFQKMYFIPSISVLDNVLLAQWLGKGKKSEKKAMDLLEKLNIAEQRNKFPSELSLGQQQRLAIVRALINKPKLILADEPTSSLDDKNAKIVAELLSSCAKEYHAALVIVTHDMRIKETAKNFIDLK